MRVMDLDHEVGDRKLQLMRPQSSGVIARSKPMTHTEEEKDVRRLADDERAALEERWRKRGMLDAFAVKECHHRWHGATLIWLARHIDIALASLFEREADEFTAPLNCGPIVQFIPHDVQRSAACRSISSPGFSQLRSIKARRLLVDKGESQRLAYTSGFASRSFSPFS